jgi:hypothetical protein
VNFLNLQEALARLPVAPNHPAGVPEPLAPYLSTPRRIAQVRCALPWVEYRLLASLALSGWSLRYALMEAEAHNLGLVVRSGSLTRACTHLAQAGLWETTTVRLAAAVSLVRLTPLGRALLAQVGLDVVESDWERVERLHRGARAGQRVHTAALCAFAYHARKRGYAVSLCPPPVGPAEPDVLLNQDGQAIYVEVQGRGGSVWRRAEKWRAIGALPGEFAICALTPQQALRYAQEARRVRAVPSLATDLTTLHRCNPLSLWTHRWNSIVEPVLPASTFVEPVLPASTLVC